MNEKKTVYRPYLLLLAFMTYILGYFYFDILGGKFSPLYIYYIDLNISSP